MDAKRKELTSHCLELEKQIIEAFGKKPRFPICNDDWTDAHQEFLEWQLFINDLNTSYIKAQKQLFDYLKSIGVNHYRKIRTAHEYYKLQMGKL